MNIEIKTKAIPVKQYPWVGLYKHSSADNASALVVLFIEPDIGVCLKSPNEKDLGFKGEYTEHLYNPCSIKLSSLGY